MEGDKSGVRITPPVLEFYDAEANTTHQLNITVKNISKSSKSIRYYGPKTKVCAIFSYIGFIEHATIGMHVYAKLTLFITLKIVD